MIPIPTFIINLPERVERREHILHEFKNKPEFDISIVPAHKCSNGAFGLWQTIIEIIKKAISSNYDYILIIEDDHQFSINYSNTSLFENINYCNTNEGDILLGGVSSLESGFGNHKNLVWIDHFTGLQFTIIFQRAFRKIINTNFRRGDNADLKLSEICTNKLLITPFFSIQREFGYSDVTSFYNDNPGYIDNLFKLAEKKALFIKSRSSFYENICGELDNAELLTEFELESRIPILNVSNKNQNEAISVIDKSYGFSTINVDSVYGDLIGIDQLKKILLSYFENHEVIAVSTRGFKFENMINYELLQRLLSFTFVSGGDILVADNLTFEFSVPFVHNLAWINKIDKPSLIFIFKSGFLRLLKNDAYPTENLVEFINRVCLEKYVAVPFLGTCHDNVIKDKSGNFLPLHFEEKLENLLGAKFKKK